MMNSQQASTAPASFNNRSIDYGSFSFNRDRSKYSVVPSCNDTNVESILKKQGLDAKTTTTTKPQSSPPSPQLPASSSASFIPIHWSTRVFLDWLHADAHSYDQPGVLLEDRSPQTLACYVRRWAYECRHDITTQHPDGTSHTYSSGSIGQQQQLQPQGMLAGTGSTTRQAAAATSSVVAESPLSPPARIVNYYTAALAMGIAIGVLIIPYKLAIEFGLDMVWEHIPDFLERRGVFDHIPSYFYIMAVMTLTCVGAGLAFDTTSIPMPDQNTLLVDMRSAGRTSSYHFWRLTVVSILAMWGGLPLGPELPLLLMFAMLASAISEQLSLNDTQSRYVLYMSQSAAIGAFFSYPIGAFFFVMELPHRMGFFHTMGAMHAELLGPCSVASLVATLVCGYCTSTPVERMFDFPGEFIPDSLSCTLPFVVLIAAAVGTYTGMAYASVAKSIKTMVHGISDVFAPEESLVDDNSWNSDDSVLTDTNSYFEVTVRHRAEAKAVWRAHLKVALHGVVCAGVGVIISMICLLFPHCFSWGEAQMQFVLDNGVTSLPFFDDDSPLVSPFAQCMVTESGMVPPIWCMAAIPCAKILCIGLALATGVRCGHFWGPIFVAAAIGQWCLLAADALLGITTDDAGIFLLCCMSAAHVVTFRSPIGIAFLLMQSAGYDITCFVAAICAAHISLHMSGNVIVFYKEQKDHAPLFQKKNENGAWDNTPRVNTKSGGSVCVVV